MRGSLIAPPSIGRVKVTHVPRRVSDVGSGRDSSGASDRVRLGAKVAMSPQIGGFGGHPIVADASFLHEARWCARRAQSSRFADRPDSAEEQVAGGTASADVRVDRTGVGPNCGLVSNTAGQGNSFGTKLGVGRSGHAWRLFRACGGTARGCRAWTTAPDPGISWNPVLQHG